MRWWSGSTRPLQIGFVIVLGVCAAQVGWWMIDQMLYAPMVQERLMQIYANEVRAAEEMLRDGFPMAQVLELYPDLRPTSGGPESASSEGPLRLELDPSVAAAIREERRHRLNMYAWEGSFFLLVLLAGMGVLAKAIGDNARLRRRQQNFLAAVSHELKSPLANIRLSTETMRLRRLEGEAQRRHLARIMGNLYRIERMVTNLLDTAWIDEGRAVLESEDVRLYDAVQSVRAATEFRALDAGTTVSIAVPENLCVHANADAVEAVLHNLVDNAIESVARCDGTSVSVSAEQSGNTVRLEVRDDGCGFEASEAERLFEKFYRPGDELRRSGRGSGLGLYIVRQIMSQTGGKVSAHSDGAGHGATFTVTWPAVADNTSAS